MESQWNIFKKKYFSVLFPPMLLFWVSLLFQTWHQSPYFASLQRQACIFDRVFPVCLWFDQVLGKDLPSLVRCWIHSPFPQLTVLQFLDLCNFVSTENITPSFLSQIYLELLLLKYQIASRCLMPPTHTVPLCIPMCVENSSTKRLTDMPAKSGQETGAEKWQLEFRTCAKYPNHWSSLLWVLQSGAAPQVKYLLCRVTCAFLCLIPSTERLLYVILQLRARAEQTLSASRMDNL